MVQKRYICKKNVNDSLLLLACFLPRASEFVHAFTDLSLYSLMARVSSCTLAPSHSLKMILFEREFGYAAFYNINDSVLARVWYVFLQGLVTKAARLLNIIGTSCQ
jgi:hypothetical protein